MSLRELARVYRDDGTGLLVINTPEGRSYTALEFACRADAMDFSMPLDLPEQEGKAGRQRSMDEPPEA